MKYSYILPVLEVSLQKQPHYVISEYAVGGTLHDRILSQPPGLIPLQEVIVILSQVGHEQPLAPRLLNPDLPTRIEQAILKALTKKPTERHTDVMTFVKELHGGSQIFPLV